MPLWYGLCMKYTFPKNAVLDAVIEDVRAHGDINLSADRAGVEPFRIRGLLTYVGDDPQLIEASTALQLAQVEGKRNQKNYAKQRFLSTLERRASVSEAVASQPWYTKSFFETWRMKDVEFDRAWCEAIERAVDGLRSEAWRRGAEGVDEPVTHLGHYCYDEDPDTGQKRQVVIRKYSDGLLTTLLKRYDPAFRERMGVDLSASVEGGLTQDAAMKALGELSPDELSSLSKLLEVSETDEPD